MNSLSFAQQPLALRPRIRILLKTEYILGRETRIRGERRNKIKKISSWYILHKGGIKHE